MQATKFRYEVLIREMHLDTFGHVNHAMYLVLFEEARWDLATKGGYGLKRIQEKQEGPVILEAKIRFKRELRLRDLVTIETVCISYDKTIGSIAQVMTNSLGQTCCRGEFKIGLFDLKERRLIPPTDEWLTAIGVRIR